MKTFLAGLGAGYAVGTLFAPKSGSEARQDLSRAVRDIQNVTRKQGSRIKEAIGDPQELINRAKREAKPYLEQAQEAVANATQQLKQTAQSVASKAGVAALVMLNTASRDDLLAIYGIGPVLADKIIKGRPYTSEREVVDRGIIPEATLKEIARSWKSA
jgi:DNA uptake protein ComE-like DNA-binding protein